MRSPRLSRYHYNCNQPESQIHAYVEQDGRHILARLDKTELQEWIKILNEERPSLETLWKAFDWIIQDAEYVTLQEVISEASHAIIQSISNILRS